MNWYMISTAFLVGSQLGLCWLLYRLTRALCRLVAMHAELQMQHERDMKMVKGITDTLADNDLKLAQQDTETMKVVRLLQFLNDDDENQVTE